MLNSDIKKKLTHYSSTLKVAGTDEAGRGCLAGPVTAAAVILDSKKSYKAINDSKQLSANKRNALREIIEKEAYCYHITHIPPVEIDEINILNASLKAMALSLDALPLRPELILVDGNRFNPYQDIPHECMIKGDGRFLSIAAASILAKTYRDAYMARIHEEYPMYNWLKNKGYPTKEHREAIRKYGITKYHRKSFQLLPAQMELKF